MKSGLKLLAAALAACLAIGAPAALAAGFFAGGSDERTEIAVFSDPVSAFVDANGQVCLSTTGQALSPDKAASLLCVEEGFAYYVTEQGELKRCALSAGIPETLRTGVPADAVYQKSDGAIYYFSAVDSGVLCCVSVAEDSAVESGTVRLSAFYSSQKTRLMALA